MYSGIVSAISVRPHPNADRLQLGIVHGFQVVVGQDVKDGQVGVFFPTDGQLSHEMCLENGLYRESAAIELGLEPRPPFGFFEVNRRVRSQLFRKAKSDGFWIEIDKLSWTGVDIDSLKVGDTIDTLNGQLVCSKYYSPATLRAMKGGTKATIKATSVIFPKHIDTAQLRYYIGSIKAGSLITITEKLHGTSGRYGNVLESTKLSGWRKGLRLITGRPTVDKRWVNLNGSRNVTLSEAQPGYYGTNDFRYDVTRGTSLHKGEVIYFEIVGSFLDKGGNVHPIMTPQDVGKDMKVERLAYGDVMSYNYGCAAGEHRAYVYRITRLNEDGVETDLSWAQVQARSAELGFRVVPTLDSTFVYNGNAEQLEDRVNILIEGSSTLDPRHIREGVVLRVESEAGTYYYKSKSWTFGVLEGYLKDKADVVDLEEAS